MPTVSKHRQIYIVKQVCIEYIQYTLCQCLASFETVSLLMLIPSMKPVCTLVNNLLLYAFTRWYQLTHCIWCDCSSKASVLPRHPRRSNHYIAEVAFLQRCCSLYRWLDFFHLERRSHGRHLPIHVLSINECYNRNH